MYAAAKKALGDCDRCGFTYKLNNLKYEIQDSIRNGLRVCTQCFDKDHPQYKLGELNITDNQALFNPRPDRGLEESTTYFGFNPVSGISLILTSEVGTVTVSTE
tara:strand:- start:13 stop:324 length:312 start_codon:yes stop_codon:yes gene_type:complete